MMIEVDCSMWRCERRESPKGEVRVEFQTWETNDFPDWPCSAESLLPKPNKLTKRGLMFHVRVTFDPRNRPMWRRPPWQDAAFLPWVDITHGVPVAIFGQRTDNG